MPQNHDRNGRFAAGNCANPGGRPKKDPDAMAILRAAVPGAARKLVELAKSENPKIAMQATAAILDRVWGKPTQAQEIHMEGALDLRAEVRAALLERARAAGAGGGATGDEGRGGP